MRCFSLLPMYIGTRLLKNANTYTLTAVDNYSVTAINIDLGEEHHLNAAVKLYPYGYRVMSLHGRLALSMCSNLVGNASSAIKDFMRVVRPERINNQRDRGPRDDICEKEILESNKATGRYLLSSMGDIGKFCEPKMITGLIASRRINYSGPYDCLSGAPDGDAPREISVANKPIVEADIQMSRVIIDDRAPAWTWRLGKGGDDGDMVMAYTNSMPIVLHHLNDGVVQHVLAGISPYLRPHSNPNYKTSFKLKSRYPGFTFAEELNLPLCEAEEVKN